MYCINKENIKKLGFKALTLLSQLSLTFMLAGLPMPSNASYTLQNYGFGSGGSSNISNGGTNNMQVVIGQTNSNPLTTPTGMLKPALIYAEQLAIPNAPSTLGQFKADGITAIVNHTYTSDGISTNIIFTFSMSSSNRADYLKPEIELETNSTSFTGTPNYSGSTVTYTGSPVTGTVTVTGLSNCTGYHWQAFVLNSTGLSTPTIFNTTTPNFTATNVSPTAGSVYDGNTNGTESHNTLTISSVASNWTGFSDACSGLAATPYQVAIGITPGGTTIQAYSSTGISLGTYNTLTVTSLPLHTGITYFISVKAINNAGLSTIVNSTGQWVVPSLTFSIGGSSVNLGSLNNGNSFTATNTTTLAVTNNAYNGYNVNAAETGLMTSTENGTWTISDYSAIYPNPTNWTAGLYGFGYTSSATSINGSNIFHSGTYYVGFNHTAPGDTVAQNQTLITGSNYTGTPDNYTETYKVAVPSTQHASSYQTSIIYTVVASF